VAFGAGIKLILGNGPIMGFPFVFMAEPQCRDDHDPGKRKNGKNLFGINMNHCGSSICFHSIRTIPLKF
jgi:hypothetical protein